LREFEFRQAISENPLPLTQIRDAALASKFPSREALDRWLEAVLGENRVWLDRANEHTRRALQLCPLQGDGYIHLAEFAFLDHDSRATKQAYIQQALAVRPYSGAVLMAAGGEAFLAGDTDASFRYWKRAFQQAPDQRLEIIRRMAAQFPAETFIETFEPDTDGLRQIYSFYREQKLVPQSLEAGTHFANALVQDADRQEAAVAAEYYSQAAEVYDFLGDNYNYLQCAQRAVRLSAENYRMRRSLTHALTKCARYEDAIDQLRWCRSRRPDDKDLVRELNRLNRLRLQSQHVQVP
jgi:hypothetical protein